MSFRIWFGFWIRSILKLLTASSRRKRGRRPKVTRFAKRRYHVKKKYRKKRRRSHTVQSIRFSRALFGCMAMTLGVLLLPFGLLHWGRQSAKARERKSAPPREARIPATKRGSPSEPSRQKTVVAAPPSAVREHAPAPSPPEFSMPDFTLPTPAPKAEVSAPAEDESTPRSTPKSERDRYIRKRMTFTRVDSHPSPLRVGMYLGVEREENAVKLTLDGKTVGYIPDKDKTPVALCLRQGRKVYAVITAEIAETAPQAYEFETWFAEEDR